MSEFPVEHAVQAVLADHEIAGPEVAVDQRVRGRSRAVPGEPAQTELNCRPGLGESLILLGHLAERVDRGQVPDRTGIHLVDPGQDLPEAVREARPHTAAYASSRSSRRGIVSPSSRSISR